MLTSTALVLMMTIPGLALFYGGMVRKKNVLATLMQSFAITCVVTILWWLIGYSSASPPAAPYLGGVPRLTERHAVMKDANKVSVSHLALTIPETVYAMFQLTFAIITPALICGAFAERMKFSAMLLFMSLWVAGRLRSHRPLGLGRPSGWLRGCRALSTSPAAPWCTSTPASPVSWLPACSASGRATARRSMPPHNLTFTLIGASLLWVGWFGFNAGSAVAADGRRPWRSPPPTSPRPRPAWPGCSAEWIIKGKPTCWASPRARWPVWSRSRRPPASSAHAGGGHRRRSPASSASVAPRTLKSALGYDDSLDAFGVHGIGGIIGALLTGVFASKEISGSDGSVITQLWGVGTTVIYGGVMSFIILKVIDMTIGLRVSEDQEREGLDISLHGERVE